MVKNVVMTCRWGLTLLLHILLGALAFTASFAIRFDGSIPPDQLRVWSMVLPFAVLLKGLAVFHYRVSSGLWRYVSMDDLVRILKTTTLSSAALVIGVAYFYGSGFPKSVLVIDYLLTIILYGGMRFCIRISREIFRPTVEDSPGRRTIIIGAGDTGEIALRTLKKDYTGVFTVVAFLDDDPMKQGMYIHGYPIHGPISDAPRLVRELKVTKVVIAIPGANKKFIREIVEGCSAHNVEFHMMPAFPDFTAGDMQAEKLREVGVEDLLGREPIELDKTMVTQDLDGKCILVTGAGGSIGSELARQIAGHNPSKLVLLDSAETPLFQIEQELQEKVPHLQRISTFADIKHADLLDKIFFEFKPDIIFHAAAYKHVPLMEAHPVEAVFNNILGTRNLAEASVKHHVEKFVMISTDKAVRPTSVMGATKRCAELMVSQMNGNGTRFVSVRFGNVLGSNGSVVPTFKKQIAQGGPVKVTHPDIERFFMTIPEAVELVLQAGTIGKGGEVFVLNMGEPIKIADLARNMIELSGLEPGKDIDIEYTGLRPGEKLYEELVAFGENVKPTSIPKVMVHKANGSGTLDRTSESIWESLKPLEEAAMANNEEGVLKILWEVVRRHDPDVKGPASTATQAAGKLEEVITTK